MGYIGSRPADQALTGADIQDGSIQLADISVAARNDLGNTDLYGFAKTHTAETIHVAVTESGSKFYIAGVYTSRDSRVKSNDIWNQFDTDSIKFINVNGFYRNLSFTEKFVKRIYI